jgi:hypothetical protein
LGCILCLFRSLQNLLRKRVDLLLLREKPQLFHVSISVFLILRQFLNLAIDELLHSPHLAFLGFQFLSYTINSMTVPLLLNCLLVLFVVL